MALLWEILINGNDVTSKVLEGTRVEHTRTGISGNTASIRIPFSVINQYSIVSGQEVKISRGTTTATDNVVFIGNIKKISENDDDSVTLKCKDPLQKLKYQLFSKSYDKDIDPEAGEYSAIFTDIAEKGGFSVDSQESGTGPTSIVATKFITRRKARLDRMSLIAKILNWFFYYDYDTETIKFQEKGFNAFSTPLEVGVNVYNIPVWDEDIESMRNKITVEGATEVDTRKETETGDGTTKTFTFTYTPQTTELLVDGVLQKRGVAGVTEEYDYTVDSDGKTYTFQTAPANATSIVMNYTTQIPVPVSGTDAASIARYELTQEEVFNFNDVVTKDDAEVRVQQLLSLLADGDVMTKLHTNEYLVQVGDSAEVIDPQRPDRSSTYIVYSKIMNYGEELDVITVGTEKTNIQDLFRTIDERLKALEGPDNQLGEILTQIFTLVRTYSFKRRYTKKLKRSTATRAVWGRGTNYEKWGNASAKWGVEVTDADRTTFAINQGGNKYKEFFYDDDFVDSVNTTAALDTNNRVVDFDADEVFQTTAVYKDGTSNSSVYSVNLSATYTGDLLFEISADGGSNWETITTEGVVQIVSNLGYELLIRATENNSSTAQLTYLEVAYTLN